MMKSIFAATLMVAFLGTCMSQWDEGKKINPDDFRADLAANRAKWEATGIESYMIRQEASCYCAPEYRGPFQVIVFKKEITWISFSISSGLYGKPEDPPVITVEEAFDRIENILNRSPPVADLTVEYDGLYGFITSYYLDEQEFLADEEFGLSFELQFLPPKPSALPGPTELNHAGGFSNDIELTFNRVIWGAFGPNDYTYRLTRSCFCGQDFVGPFLVTVTDGQVADVVFEGSEPPSQPPTDIPTIDGLFDIIEEAMNGPDKAFEVTVEYDLFFGAPLSIFIDRIEFAADDEIQYSVELLAGFKSRHKEAKRN